MALEENGIFEEKKGTISLRERLIRYLANWPVFLTCLVICVGSGILYSRYTIPQYIATTSFLIKGAEDGSSNSNDLVEQALYGRSQGVSNEMLEISSPGLMQRTVAKNAFNVSYFKKGRLLTLNVYNEAPFRLVAKQITDSNRIYIIYIEKNDNYGGVFLYGPKNEEKSYIFQWGVPFNISGQTFVLESKGRITNVGGQYVVQWQPVKTRATEFANQLSVKAIDIKTSVIELSIKAENLELGKDVLNALFAEFHLTDIEDRDKLYESTVRFVDERLLAVSGELKGVEGNLENYQANNQLIDIRGQSNQYLGNSDAASKTIKDLSVQQGVVSMIQDYFAQPANSNKLVPSSLGLNDATLASLIAQYNELQLKKERETPLVAPNSTVMQDLNTQIGNLKGSISESLHNLTKNLKLQQSSFKEQNSQYRSLLSSMPHNERVLQEIKRKQSITEGLYLYLLQKREEVAMSSSTAFNVSHYKQIDQATGYGPVEPNMRNILLYTSLLGFALAFGGIYLRDLLNDKITSGDDVTNRISLPVIGQISQIPKNRKQLISVLDRTVVGEEVRIIRANLSFLIKNKSNSNKVILITSCATNEGKSFVSLNLAAVYAISGKKVALLEFDLRKTRQENSLPLISKMGLSDYLTGQTNELFGLYQSINEIPTLHIYPSGSIPSYPADVLLSENIYRLFECLKERYDYVIVDSPPVGVVSDAFILGEFSDLTLFIIRQGVTLKKQLDFISDVNKSKKFKKIAMILNDVKAIKQYGYNDNWYTQYRNVIKKYKSKVIG